VWVAIGACAFALITAHAQEQQQPTFKGTS
jgi:predicted outer membrane lipoprotein